jgi:hypothetical protein
MTQAPAPELGDAIESVPAMTTDGVATLHEGAAELAMTTVVKETAPVFAGIADPSTRRDMVRAWGTVPTDPHRRSRWLR